jgi:hypothetical protein
MSPAGEAAVNVWRPAIIATLEIVTMKPDNGSENLARNSSTAPACSA